MEQPTPAVPAPRASEPEPEEADEGFAPTRFFTGHFANHRVLKQQRRRRKLKVLAIVAGASLTGIALLGLAVSLTNG